MHPSFLGTTEPEGLKVFVYAPRFCTDLGCYTGKHTVTKGPESCESCTYSGFLGAEKSHSETTIVTTVPREEGVC